MADDRLAERDWQPGHEGKAPTWERVNTAILLDLRDHLRSIAANMRLAGVVLHGIQGELRRARKARTITRKQAARVLARARHRRKKA